MAMNALLLLLTLTSTIVLRSGDRIAVDGPVREEKGVVIFRSNGLFYSLPASEVERIEKQEPQPAVEQETPAEAEKKVRRRLAVSEEERRRLLAELEKNHTGVPQEPLPILKEIPPPPSADEAREQREEENRWRREARAHEEAVRRANEELALLQSRAEELRSQIFSLVGLGYKPRQFTYQTTQLERILAQIPYAELRVTRAARAYEQFREDARRQGMLPGWLR
jgi:type IV secretory pathway VirB10-like protein